MVATGILRPALQAHAHGGLFFRDSRLLYYDAIETNIFH